MRKEKLSSAGIALLTLALPCLSYAALYDRGHGLIYDSVLNITWLQDAQYAQTSGYDSDGIFNWAGAETWVHQLNYLGITGWRLPSLTPVAGGTSFNTNQFSYDGSTDYAYNISSPAGASAGFTGNELAYMYFVNLHDLAQVKRDGTVQSGSGLVNVSFVDASTGQMDSFKNVRGTEGYWTGVAGAGIYAFLFLMETHPGFNDVANTVGLYGAWAVHDGDVAAPSSPPKPRHPRGHGRGGNFMLTEIQLDARPASEPGAVALLVVAFAVIGWLRRRGSTRVRCS